MKCIAFIMYPDDLLAVAGLLTHVFTAFRSWFAVQVLAKRAQKPSVRITKQCGSLSLLFAGTHDGGPKTFLRTKRLQNRAPRGTERGPRTAISYILRCVDQWTASTSMLQTGSLQKPGSTLQTCRASSDTSTSLTLQGMYQSHLAVSIAADTTRAIQQSATPTCRVLGCWNAVSACMPHSDSTRSSSAAAAPQLQYLC
jgi:hypothetical protein